MKLAKTNQSRFIALPIICVSLLATVFAFRPSPPVQSTQSELLPPVGIYSQIAESVPFSLPNSENPDDWIGVDLTFSTLEKVVRGRFAYDAVVDGERVEVAVETVSYPSHFQPTGITHLGGQDFAVAGVLPKSGETVIEKWSLKLPSLFKGFSSTGDIVYFLRPSSIQKVSTVFAPSIDSGFGFVRAMWVNRALGNDHLLVLNYQQGELFELNMTTQLATKVMSAFEAVSGNLPAAGLSQDWAGYFGPWRHSIEGDVYILSNDIDVAHLPHVVIDMYIWDHDMDGIPDTVEMLSENGANARDLYNDLYWDYSWPQ